MVVRKEGLQFFRRSYEISGEKAENCRYPVASERNVRKFMILIFTDREGTTASSLQQRPVHEMIRARQGKLMGDWDWA
jgi:hypothetical protein